MRWLVTGGAGFIGSHLCENLLSRGDEIVILDDFSTGSRKNLRPLLRDDARFSLLEGDVRDPHVVEALVRGAITGHVDHVVHLAAVVGVQKVLQEPTRMLTVNMEGTANVLAAAHRHRKPVFIASTSEIYGRNDATPFAEGLDAIIGPSSVGRWGYAVSKLADEFLGLAYHKEQGLPVRIGRLFNTVGPRQSGLYGMVVPRFVKAALAGEPLVVYGDGEQTRCFCHVHDTVQAVVELCLCEEAAGKVVNIGSTDEVSIKTLAERVIAWTGSSSTITHKRYEELGPEFEDMRRRVPDVSRIGMLTGWQAQKDLRRIVDDVARSSRQSVPA